MTPCASCGHTNLPGYDKCSKCGAALTPGGGGPNEYERLMAGRARAAKRNKLIYSVVGAVVMVGVGGKLWQDRAKKAADQVKIDFFDRWATLEKRETGLFWNCVMSSEVDVGMFSAAAQFQGRIESAYGTQPKTYSEHLSTECIPKIERARQAMGSLTDAPPEFRAALATYTDTLPKLQTAIEGYAEKIKNRGATRDLDSILQETGAAWHAAQIPSPQTIAFDKFLGCAIPGVDKMKDAQAVLEFLADVCFKKDPVLFMDRVRKDCGPLLQTPDPKAKPGPEYKARVKKLYEEDARQMQAWESCSKKSRKGKKVEELGDFLMAVGDYMKARSGFGAAAKELAGGSSAEAHGEKKP